MFSIINNTVTITQGDAAIFRIDIYDPRVKVDGRDKPYRLQPGDRVYMTVYPDLPNADPLFQLEGPEFVVTPEHTADAKANLRYYYDVVLEYGNGMGPNTVVEHSPFVIKFKGGSH